MKRDTVTTVIGHKCVEAEDACSFLTRNGVPHRWIDLDEDVLSQMIEGAVARDRLPLVMFPDGTDLQAPAGVDDTPAWRAELARRAGLKTSPDHDSYDVTVLGGGPAGLTSALYAASEGLRVVVIEQVAPGGQAATASRIENYPGFPEGVEGYRLGNGLAQQAKRLGAEIVVGVEAEPWKDQVHSGSGFNLSSGAGLYSSTVVVATGVKYRKLEAGGLEELVGRKAFYGSSPGEAEDWRGKTVAIVGGANSAGQAAIHFAQFAKRVVLLVRGKLDAKMSAYLTDRCRKNRRIEIREGFGVHQVQELPSGVLALNNGQARGSVKTDVLYMMIGGVPSTSWLGDWLDCDDHGYVETREGLRTSRSGVFAAGDCRSGSIKRVASAVGDGAGAISDIHSYLKESEGP